MRIFAAALAGAYLATSPLYAADLFGSAPPPMPAPVDQTELGSNWYIRGDVGLGITKQDTVIPDAGLFPSILNMPNGDAVNPVSVARGNATNTMSANISAGFGYHVNDWFRVEGTWTISNGPAYTQTKTVYCPEVANAVSNYKYTNPVNTYDTNGNVTGTTYTETATPVGYAYDYTTCNGHLDGRQYNNTVLGMGYVDLGNWGMFSPYVGVGAGVNANTLTGTLHFNQTDTGGLYNGPTVNGTAPATWVDQTATLDMKGRPIYAPTPSSSSPSGQPQPIGSGQNWTRKIDTIKYTLAGSLAAGLGVKLSQSATLDLGYHITSLDMTRGFKNATQSVNLGVRYNLN